MTDAASFRQDETALGFPACLQPLLLQTDPSTAPLQREGFHPRPACEVPSLLPQHADGSGGGTAAAGQVRGHDDVRRRAGHPAALPGAPAPPPGASHQAARPPALQPRLRCMGGKGMPLGFLGFRVGLLRRGKLKHQKKLHGIPWPPVSAAVAPEGPALAVPADESARNTP